MLYEAVRVALPEVAMVPTVAVNVPLIELAGMETEAGTEIAALLLATATEIPPAGAALDRVTVQELD